MNTRLMSKRREIDERMALFPVTSLERIEGGQGVEDLVRFGGKAKEGVKKETERDEQVFFGSGILLLEAKQSNKE